MTTAMDVPINLKMNFKGKKESFLVSDSERTTWNYVEAMVKICFGLNSVQVKYIDEENEEVSINSQEEYEEALKSAVKQGNQLHMNAYEVKGPVARQVCESGTVKRDFEVIKTGKKPVQHYSLLAEAVGQRMTPTQDKEMTMKNDVHLNQDDQPKPPLWFTAYMETFKDQVVKEAVEKICHELSERFSIQPLPQGSSNESAGVGIQVPESSSTSANTSNWLIVCSSCQNRITGICYQCSVCPFYTLCELCEPCNYEHDPAHSLIKLRTLFGTPASNHLSGNKLPAAGDHARLQKRIDKSFRKAEKQRLKAEKRPLKTEVEEIKKQLKMDRRGLHWNDSNDAVSDATVLKPRGTKSSTIVSPKLACNSIVPTMSAVFLDENLPDGTRLQPGTKFIKHWTMKNTGNVNWTTETKLKFMWGNLALASSEKKEVSVPYLHPGQVGVVTVEFVASPMEGTYTSHWRLAHKGEQFGPRVWCSIVVDPLPVPECPEGGANTLFSSANVAKSPSNKQEETEFCVNAEKEIASAKEEMQSSAVAPIHSVTKFESLDREREYYIPSVDLLTAQDLLSFELLDINIVQELEQVPHNTPVDMTPCMSPLHHEGPLLEKPGLGQIEEETEGTGFKTLLDVTLGKKNMASPHGLEEVEEDISGTQFVCETVIRSLTLEEAPDHKPQRWSRPGFPKISLQGQEEVVFSSDRNGDETSGKTSLPSTDLERKKPDEQSQPEDSVESDFESFSVDQVLDKDDEGQKQQDDEKDEVLSQGSSTEDYIIILPDCFDTSRPLGESMYSSALSQPEKDAGIETDSEPEQLEPRGEELAPRHSINDMLCASQTLDAVPLTPEVVFSPPPQTQREDNRSQNQVPDETEHAVGEMPINEVYQPLENSIEVSRSVQHQSVEPSGVMNLRQECNQDNRHHGGIAGGLVKGALSVAASAYKAFFTGQPVQPQQPVDSVNQNTTMMDVLVEMGFGDRQLNQRLLKKHNCNMIDVVNELVQMSDNDWYSTRY